MYSVVCSRGTCGIVMMFREVLIFGLIYLVHTQELQEGSPCISDGIKGICRKSKVCPSVALHVQDTGVICSNDGDEPVVCCTDCHIEDVSNVAVTLDGIVWKSGGARKSYDKCVEYASTLPYECKSSGVRLAVNKKYDEASGCHRLQVIVKQGPAPVSPKQRVDFPHLALLGYELKENSTILWHCQGFIISPRFILSPGHCGRSPRVGPLTHIAVGINKSSEDPEKWKKFEVLRFINHPEYKPPNRYNDISLVETKTDIHFGVNVLPICLADQPSDPNIAQIDILSATEEDDNDITRVRKLDSNACSELFQPYRLLREGINHTTQFCYKDVKENELSCRGSSGRPIYISGDLKCMNVAIGMVTFGRTCGTPFPATVYTRIQAFLPWIEATVWP